MTAKTSMSGVNTESRSTNRSIFQSSVERYQVPKSIGWWHPGILIHQPHALQKWTSPYTPTHPYSGWGQESWTFHSAAILILKNIVKIKTVGKQHLEQTYIDEVCNLSTSRDTSGMTFTHHSCWRGHLSMAFAEQFVWALQFAWPPSSILASVSGASWKWIQGVPETGWPHYTIWNYNGRWQLNILAGP